MSERHPGGRPAVYANTEAGLAAFREDTKAFVARQMETGEKRTMRAWADYIGVSRMTLYTYCSRGGSWASVLSSAERECLAGNAG